MELRASNLRKLRNGEFDVVIVGGGINGAVCAASLAARGARVALIERGDFAGQTSSESSNLAWGGIKYLETHEYLLVNRLCKSRNHLMNSFPSTVREIRFLATVERGFRFPPLMIYAGALLYWVMGRFRTHAPQWLSKRRLAKREPVIDVSDARAGIEYSDCYLYDNDARFVFNFVRTAMNYGAIAANYVEATAIERRDGVWVTQAMDSIGSESFPIRSRVLINACGPHVDDLNALAGQHTQYHHVLSKGIHLIVDSVSPARRILAFFASDGRLFFVMPMGPKTCIGTTDTRVEDPHTGVTDEDRDFVLANANELLKLPRTLTREDIVAERCGVRPLAVRGEDGNADWVALSRRHVVELDQQRQHISIFGGKITDCLNIGNEAADAMASLGIELPYPQRKWYGEPDAAVKEEFIHQARLMDLEDMRNPAASEALTTRFWRRYGARAFEMLENIRHDPGSAEPLIENTEYLRCEIEEAAKYEMITKLDDFLRRRSKITMVMRPEEVVRAPGLREACRILFGEEANARFNEYLSSEGITDLASDTDPDRQMSAG